MTVTIMMIITIMSIYIHIYIYIYIYIHTEILQRHILRPMAGLASPSSLALSLSLGIHYRGVQWEGGAVDGGSII